MINDMLFCMLDYAGERSSLTRYSYALLISVYLMTLDYRAFNHRVISE
jgi:hypothetical protein